jgi:hypothetical protein
MESEAVLCYAVCILAKALAAPSNLRYAGGAPQYTATLLALVHRALTAGDSVGRGCWLQLLSVTVRALARFSASEAGRMALVQTRGVATLLAVLRAEMRVCLLQPPLLHILPLCQPCAVAAGAWRP